MQTNFDRWAEMAISLAANTANDRLVVAYIAGPMAEEADHGYPAFECAADRLKETGKFVVLSPRDGAPHLSMVDDAMRADDRADFRDTKLYAQMMHRNCQWILTADIVFMLPGWETSRGASFEHELADICGITIADGTWLLKD